MNLTVIGSTGRTGRHVVDQALRRDHRVTAFTRRPDALTERSRLAGVVAGDGRDPEAVATAVRGADAVIAIVAAASRRGPHQAAEVIRVVTAAMARAGVRRLVVTSAYPIVGVRPRLPLAILRMLFRDAYADARAMERELLDSPLDWTIARLNRLTDKPAQGPLQITTDLLDRPRPMTRADTAAALLDIAADPRFARRAVNLSGPVPVR